MRWSPSPAARVRPEGVEELVNVLVCESQPRGLGAGDVHLADGNGRNVDFDLAPFADDGAPFVVFRCEGVSELLKSEMRVSRSCSSAFLSMPSWTSIPARRSARLMSAILGARWTE